MRVEYHPEAEAELWCAVERYEREYRGKGRRFHAQVRNALDMARVMPHSAPLWPLVAARLPVRRRLIRRFPYALAYIVRDEALWVFAIAHHKRQPGYWLHRLTSH